MIIVSKVEPCTEYILCFNVIYKKTHTIVFVTRRKTYTIPAKPTHVNARLRINATSVKTHRGSNGFLFLTVK
jgi:hypothetical protein